MVESIVSRRFEPFEKNTGFDKATCGEQNFEYIYSCGMWVYSIWKLIGMTIKSVKMLAPDIWQRIQGYKNKLSG